MLWWRRRAAPKGESASEETSGAETGSSTPAVTNPRAKIDKSGLYDLAQVKRLLDDEMIECMEAKGYDEAVLVSNIKILAGTIAVAAAMFSHFNPWEFPGNRNIVLGCVLLYGACIGSINLSAYIWDANAMYVGRLAAKAKRIAKSKLPEKVWVSTRLGEKGSSIYRLTIRTSPQQSEGKVEITNGYEKYFTEEGRFLATSFQTDLSDAVSQVGSGSKKSN